MQRPPAWPQPRPRPVSCPRLTTSLLPWRSALNQLTGTTQNSILRIPFPRCRVCGCEMSQLPLDVWSETRLPGRATLPRPPRPCCSSSGHLPAVLRPCPSGCHHQTLGPRKPGRPPSRRDAWHHEPLPGPRLPFWRKEGGRSGAPSQAGVLPTAGRELTHHLTPGCTHRKPRSPHSEVFSQSGLRINGLKVSTCTKKAILCSGRGEMARVTSPKCL